MIKKYSKALCITMIIMLISIIVGCSSKEEPTSPVASTEPSKASTEPSKAPVVNNDPVNLKIMWFNTLVSKEAIEQFISKPVKQKYPNITIEYVEVATGAALPDLIASGQNIPDIVITDYSNLSSAIELGYPQDLNDSLKKANVDLSKMEESPLNGVKALGGKGELYGLPLYLDKYMMFYNKDIFDRFAIPYPTGEMSYGDLVNLVKRLTRSEGGVQYVGYRWADLYTFGFQFGLPVINAKTGKADLQTEGWKNALSLMKQMVDMGVDNSINHETFLKEKRLAIYPQWMGAAYGLFEKDGTGLNWDVAALPYSKDSPKTSGPTKPIYLLASSVSKNKEQAIAAISYVTTSPEVQSLLSQNGRISVLKDDAIKKQFGTKLAVLAGKNANAVFQYPFGSLPNTTAYESLAWDGLDTAPASIMKGIDVNTALRTAEEAANKKVDEYFKMKK